ncbi:NRDE family protein [Elioraea rosea]|uniref:NRDE family protein n=1 Tax=Elioraea rosea TaxID=2492390 RepID=UPI00118464AB|nr:NRDE family protein [Elioraea rosea]
MCTVVISHRPDAAWPIAIAANRDEMLDRPWDPPAAHWPDRPGVVGGRDRLAGGTWMAMRGGTVAAVLNRPGSLGPAEGFRSRGELPLLALGHGTAARAAEAMASLPARAWRPFNLVVADRAGAWLIIGDGDGTLAAARLGEGVSMVTSIGLDEAGTPRARRHLPRFRALPHPAPSTADAWAEALGATDAEAGAGRRGGLTIPPDLGYGTVAASLVFLPRDDTPAVWLFAAGPAGAAPFRPVPLAQEARSARA